MLDTTGRERPLDPRSVVAGRLTGAVTLAVLSVPVLLTIAAILFSARVSAPAKLGLVIAWVGTTGMLVLVVLVWPSLRYRYTRYRVDGHGLTIRRGVVWRSVTAVPTSRVQHTDVLQGPLQRQFGLATLVVHTAGTQGASVSLSGLSHEEAVPLRDFLIHRRDDDHSPTV